MVSPSGAANDTIEIPNPASDFQNTCGVVAGNQLIVFESGSHEVLSVELTTHDTSISRFVQDDQGWLGAIDFIEGAL
jgi:hypothetical protein